VKSCRSERFKPTQSGNPKGRPQGSRNKLSEEFFRDLYDAWEAFGKPALMTAAWTHPVEFVRVIADAERARAQCALLAQSGHS
jgi:hypothetical protein